MAMTPHVDTAQTVASSAPVGTLSAWITTVFGTPACSVLPPGR